MNTVDNDSQPKLMMNSLECLVNYKPQDFGFENNLRFCTYKSKGLFCAKAEVSPNLFSIRAFETEEQAKKWLINQMPPRTKGIYVNNKSGVRGVFLKKYQGYEAWVATIKVKGKLYTKQFQNLLTSK